MIDSQVVYIGRHAELYDLFYSAKDYKGEAKFVSGLLKKWSVHNQPATKVLELACGTGSYGFELESLGHNLVCLDNSADMLAMAKQKAALRESKIDFLTADMRDFEIAGDAFDAVVCLFDSLGYAGDNEAILQVLIKAGHHLKPGGLLIFEFWHAPAVLNDFDPARVRLYQDRDGNEIIRISNTRLDIVAQSAQIEYRVVELRTDGTYSTFSETQSNRYFSVPEMEMMLSNAKFRPLQWCAGFDDKIEISQDTWHIVAVAQRV